MLFIFLILVLVNSFIHKSRELTLTLKKADNVNENAWYRIKVKNNKEQVVANNILEISQKLDMHVDFFINYRPHLAFKSKKLHQLYFPTPSGIVYVKLPLQKQLISQIQSINDFLYFMREDDVIKPVDESMASYLNTMKETPLPKPHCHDSHLFLNSKVMVHSGHLKGCTGTLRRVVSSHLLEVMQEVRCVSLVVTL